MVGDITFKMVPQHLQLYMIHRTYHVNFCTLFDGQKNRMYNARMYNAIKEISSYNWFELHPRAILMNFEIESINAITNIFPKATKKKCLFHFSNNIWKNARN